MRTITATDLRKRLGEYLDAASSGERILIERDHQPYAYLISIEDAARIDPTRGERVRRRLAALDRLEEIGDEYRAAHPWQPGEMTAAEAIRWDRDYGHDHHEPPPVRNPSAAEGSETYE